MVIKFYGLRMPTKILSDALLLTDPDAYIDVVDAPDTIPITFKFTFVNNEGRTLYVKAELVDAPEGYSMEPVEVGFVGNGKSVSFEVTVYRTKPESTDFAELEESITLRISAYTDSEYSALYSFVDVSLNIHIINSAHPSWSVVKSYDFDDGELKDITHAIERVGSEKTCETSVKVSSYYYVTPPYSCRVGVDYAGICDRYIYAVIPVDLRAYTKAYLVAYARIWSPYLYHMKVVVGDRIYIFNLPEQEVWYKIVVPLNTEIDAVKVGVYCGGWEGYLREGLYLDSIKIIAM